MNIFIHCPENHSVNIHSDRLGSEVLCPHCYVSFRAELNLDTERYARSEKGKARPSRDDDDEDEKPKKKTKPKSSKKKDDDEDEKPRAKKSARKKVEEEDEEEEEDDDDEDEEEEEKEEPTQWTPRKVQLQFCRQGLQVMTVANWIFAAFYGLLGLSIIMAMLGAFAWFGAILLTFVVIPCIVFTTGCFLAGIFISLAVPAKAEAKGSLLAGMISGGGFLFLLLILLINRFNWFFLDELRRVNLYYLLLGSALLAFIVFYLSIMAYQSKLLTFMKLNLESTVPLSNGIFILLCFIAICLFTYLDAKFRPSFGEYGDYVGYVVIGLYLITSLFAIYLISGHASLIQKLRQTIWKYIRDE